MQKARNILQDKIKIYELWVAKNPNVVNEFEAASKWLSYLLVSRVSDSRIASELVYSASNLLVLYHDRILASAKQQSLQNDGNMLTTINKNKKFICNILSLESLKILLTTIEHCEVFIELSVERLSGERGKWLTVAFLQIITCTGRMLLLRHSNENIVIMPPITFLNRKELAKSNTTTTTKSSLSLNASKSHGGEVQNSFSFQLKRSGRTVRKVEGAPPLHFREFNIFNSNSVSPHNDNLHTSRNKKFLHAEYIYIAKPLVHLAAMYIAGDTRSWMPYYVSLGMDLASFRNIYANRQQLSKEQRLELSRRCIRLGLYLMRSPFYERHTSARLQLVLTLLGNVPLLKLITNAMLDYLPLWQKTYFQTWGV